MLNSYFSFRKSDRKVNSVLLMLLILVVGIWMGKQFFGSNKENDKDDNTEALLTEADSTSSGDKGRSQSDTTQPQVFDPNTVDAATLMKIGISKKKAVALVHYRESGKVFGSENDVLSTYNWTPEDLDLVRPYMHIDEGYRRKVISRPEYTYEPRHHRASLNWERKDSTRHELTYKSNKFTSPTTVDLNTADTTLLMRIPGIGSYFSRQIVFLRERLGGYVNVEQLSEILNFPTETLSWFEIKDTKTVRRINPNTAEFRQMASHPYIGSKRTKDIQNFIRLSGPIRSIQHFRSTNIFTDTELEKLIPYIDLPMEE